MRNPTPTSRARPLARLRLAGFLLAMACVLGLGAAPVLADDASGQDSALDDVRADLDQKIKRFERIQYESSRSAQDRDIEIYANYSAKDLREKPAVTAEDILEIITDNKIPTDTRRRGLDAIEKQKSKDPKLSRARPRPNRQTPLADFSEEVADCLDEGDRKCDAWARKSLHEWLLKEWGGARRERSISTYDPEKRGTWRDAVKAWKKYLGDR